MAGTGEGGEEEQIQGAPGVVGDGSLSSVGWLGGSFFGAEGPSIHSKQTDDRGDRELRAT